MKTDGSAKPDSKRNIPTDNRGKICRAIAFHLPQFHPIPENDEWWGKGFTEWTNVAKTTPRFEGHYQPHLPADLGFYDLRLPQVRAAQAQLAAEYGIYGFCYYHYWFHGRRLLERPVDEIWKSGEPDFPFCLCWANENWTRQWDGHNNEILVEQRYSVADDLDHIRNLIPLFNDTRYIRVMDKPLFAVYRASALPEPQRTMERWRREAERAGLKGLFLVRVEGHDQTGDPRELGFDCAVDFHPRGQPLAASHIYRRRWWQRRKLRTAERAYSDNYISDYASYVSAALAAPMPVYPWIPCVCPGWDNSPRRRKGAFILTNSTPESYGRWLGEVVNRRKAAMQAEEEGFISPESLVFINGWNEWAEGNHLEPCQRWGHAYLEATRGALQVPADESLTACLVSGR